MVAERTRVGTIVHGPVSAATDVVVPSASTTATEMPSRLGAKAGVRITGLPLEAPKVTAGFGAEAVTRS